MEAGTHAVMKWADDLALTQRGRENEPKLMPLTMGKRLISAQADAAPGGLPRPFHVPHRRQADETVVFPIEERGVVVANAVSAT